MHNIPFITGGIDNLSRDSRSISRDVSVSYIPKVGNFREQNINKSLPLTQAL